MNAIDARHTAPRVNVAVCGIFHYRNYLRHLHELGVIQRFYYSHRLTTDATTLGLSEEIAVNSPIKEFLVHGSRRLLGVRGDVLFPLLHDLWQSSVMRRWQRSDLWHFMVHGSSRKLMRRARDEGALLLGEPVNAHPLVQKEILDKERDRLGFPPVPELSLQERRLADELDYCDHLLVPSHWIKRSMIHQGKAEDRVHVIPWCVDAGKFKPASEREPGRPLRVVCVASIGVRKGQYFLLEAWKRLKPANAELVLIGPLENEYKPVLDRYQGLYRHISRIPHHELGRFLAQCDLFVLPSLEDGFAYVCLEAMACGLPVIVTENTGAAELVTEGVHGYTIPIANIDAISDKVGLLMGNDEMRREMANHCIHDVQRLYQWRDYAVKLAHLYQNLLNGRGNSASENGGNAGYA